MKKKILIVNKMYYPNIGGVETIVKQYAEYLADDFDVSVLVVSPIFKIKTVFEKINGVNVIRCSSFGTFLSMPVSISFLIRLFFLRNDFHYIHFHEPFPLATLFAVFPKKNKYIVTWHSDIVKQKKIKAVIGFFQKLLCSKADVVLTTSPNLASNSDILQYYKNKVEVLPLSIDNTKYCAASYEVGKYLLYIGRLSYYKGLINLIDAYELSNSHFPLYIVGDGDKQIVKEIKERILKSKKNIIFKNNYVTENEKNEYLKNCRALMFPSTQRSEAFGIVQLEAMIYRKPVINTHLPTGVPWVSLDGVTGITIQPDSIPELADAINALNSDELVKTYGNNAYARVSGNFLDQVVLDKLKYIYNHI